MPLLCAGCNLHRDNEHMHAIYGDHVLVGDVLSGHVPAPDEVSTQ